MGGHDEKAKPRVQKKHAMAVGAVFAFFTVAALVTRERHGRQRLEHDRQVQRVCDSQARALPPPSRPLGRPVRQRPATARPAATPPPSCFEATLPTPPTNLQSPAGLSPHLQAFRPPLPGSFNLFTTVYAPHSETLPECNVRPPPATPTLPSAHVSGVRHGPQQHPSYPPAAATPPRAGNRAGAE